MTRFVPAFRRRSLPPVFPRERVRLDVGYPKQVTFLTNVTALGRHVNATSRKSLEIQA